MLSDRVVHSLRLLRELAAFSDQTRPHEETAARLRREFVDSVTGLTDEESEELNRAIRKATNT